METIPCPTPSCATMCTTWQPWHTGPCDTPHNRRAIAEGRMADALTNELAALETGGHLPRWFG